ncbi:hypothetical protein JCM11251_002779 [Rhodosporidiobolus azoricus]
MPPRIRSPTPSDEEDMLASDNEAVPTLAPPAAAPVSRSGSTSSGTTIKLKAPSANVLPPLPPLPSATATPDQAKSRKRGRADEGNSDEEDDEMDMDDEDDDDAEEDYDDELEEDELGEDEEDDYSPGASGTPQPRKGSRSSTRRASTSARGAASATKANKTGAAAAAGRRRSGDANIPGLSSPAPSSSRTGPAAAGGALAGMKIKFKLGAGGSAAGASSSAAVPHTQAAGPSTASSPAPSVASTAGGGGKGKKAAGGKKVSAAKKGKGKKRAETDESDASLDLSEEDDDAIPASSRYSSPGMRDDDDLSGEEDELASDGDGAGDFDDGFSSGSDRSGSDVYGGRKTARQKAKELGGDEALGLVSLPNHIYKGPIASKTEAEIAIAKAEKSRKRKSQADKKLEDEKTETINRLLKKQVGRAGSTSSTKAKGGARSRSKLNKSVTAGDEGSGDEIDSAAVAKAKAADEERLRRANLKPTVARWISSIRPPAPPAPPAQVGGTAAPAPPPTTTTAEEASFRLSYSVPEGLSFEGAQPPPVKKSKGPPQTRSFSAAEKAEMRRRNEDGWRKVLLGAA